MKLPDLFGVISADFHAQPCSILKLQAGLNFRKLLDALMAILAVTRPLKSNKVVTFELLLFNSFKLNPKPLIDS